MFGGEDELPGGLRLEKRIGKVVAKVVAGDEVVGMKWLGWKKD